MLFVSDNILVLYIITTHLADLGEPEQRHLRLASAWILQDGGKQEQEELVGLGLCEHRSWLHVCWYALILSTRLCAYQTGRRLLLVHVLPTVDRHHLVKIIGDSHKHDRGLVFGGDRHIALPSADGARL